MIRRSAILPCAIALLLSPYGSSGRQTQSQQPAAQPQPAPPQDPEKLREYEETRANILMARKQYSEAIPIYLRLVQQEKDPRRKGMYYNRIGIAFQQQGMFNLAKRHYERAAKTDRSNASAINNLGTVHYQNKKYKQAIRSYKKALTVDLNLAAVYSNLGYAYFADKKYELAMETLRHALELDPAVFEHGSSSGSLLQDRSVTNRGFFYFLLAKSFASSGNAERCAHYLRKARDEGYAQYTAAANDPAFASVRQDPQIREILQLADTTSTAPPPGR